MNSEIGYQCECTEDNVVPDCKTHDAGSRAREVRRLLIQSVAELAQGLRILADEISHGRVLGTWGTLQQLGHIVSMQDALVKELPRG